MGDEGPDSTPPSSCGSPRPILPFHLTSACSDKRVSGGFAAGIALGRGGHRVCSISSPAPDLTSPFPASAMEEEEGALTRSHCVPSPVTRGLCWGTGQAPCAGSPVRRCGQRAGTPHQDRQGRQGQAWGLQGGGLKGYSGIVLVVTVPRAGLSGRSRSLRALRGVTELLLSCLLRKSPSGSKFCLVSRHHLQEPVPVWKPGQSSRDPENLVLRNPRRGYGKLPWHHQSCCSPTAPLMPQPRHPSSDATRVLARVRR